MPHKIKNANIKSIDQSIINKAPKNIHTAYEYTDTGTGGNNITEDYDISLDTSKKNTYNNDYLIEQYKLMLEDTLKSIRAEIDYLTDIKLDPNASNYKTQVYGVYDEYNPDENWTAKFNYNGKECLFYNGLWSDGKYLMTHDDLFNHYDNDSYFNTFLLYNKNVFGEDCMKFGTDAYNEALKAFNEFINSKYADMVDELYNEKVGMSYDECQSKINSLKQDASSLDNALYYYKQQIKEQPYIDIADSEDYKNFLLLYDEYLKLNIIDTIYYGTDPYNPNLKDTWSKINITFDGKEYKDILFYDGLWSNGDKYYSMEELLTGTIEKEAYDNFLYTFLENNGIHDYFGEDAILYTKIFQELLKTNYNDKYTKYTNGEITFEDYATKTSNLDQEMLKIYNLDIDVNNVIKDNALTEEQGLMYRYLLCTEGIDSASLYLTAIEDKINQQKARIVADEFLKSIKDENGNIRTNFVSSDGTFDVLSIINNYCELSGESLYIGINNFIDGMKGLFETEGIITENQYAQMYILTELTNSSMMYLNDIAENIKNTNGEDKCNDFIKNIFLKDGSINLEYAKSNLTSEEYANLEKRIASDKSIADSVFQIGTSIGNMLPSIVTSAILSKLCPALGVEFMFLGETTTGAALIGTALMGLSATGNAHNQSLVNGNDNTQSWIYASICGLSEIGLQYLLGNIPGLNAESSMSLKAIFGEGLEEFIQEYVEAGANYFVNGQTIEFDELNANALKSFLFGMITSGIMNGVQFTGQAINIKINNQDLSFSDIIGLINYINDVEEDINIKNDTNTETVSAIDTEPQVDSEYEINSGKKAYEAPSIEEKSFQIEDEIANSDPYDSDSPFMQAGDLSSGNDTGFKVVGDLDNNIEIKHYENTNSLIFDLINVDTTANDILAIEAFLQQKASNPELKGENFLYNNHEQLNITGVEEGQIRNEIEKNHNVVFASEYLSSINNKHNYNADYRISLINSGNLTSSDMITFLNEYINLCNAENLPIDSKLNARYLDAFIIYCDADNLYKYTNILNELATKFPNITNKFGTTKPFSVPLNNASYYGVSMNAPPLSGSEFKGNIAISTFTGYSGELLDMAYDRLSQKYNGDISKISSDEFYDTMKQIHKERMGYELPLWMKADNFTKFNSDINVNNETDNSGMDNFFKKPGVGDLYKSTEELISSLNMDTGFKIAGDLDSKNVEDSDSGKKAYEAPKAEQSSFQIAGDLCTEDYYGNSISLVSANFKNHKMISDLKKVIKAFDVRYGKGQGLIHLLDLVNPSSYGYGNYGPFSFITEKTGAILNKYSLQEIASALVINGNSISINPNIYNGIIRYNSKNDFNFDSPIRNFDALDSIVQACYNSKVNGTDLYGELVKSNYVKGLPSQTTYQNFITQFGDISQLPYSRKWYVSNNYHISRQENSFWHIKSSNFNDSNVTDRLYINADYDATLRFAQLFANKCESIGFPFYIKTGAVNNNGAYDQFALNRDESLVIYSSADNIAVYTNICIEIISENPDMQFYKNPLLTASIYNVIGYGEEFENHRVSYNKGRSNAINHAIGLAITDFSIKYGVSMNLEGIMSLQFNNPDVYNDFLTIFYQDLTKVLPLYDIGSDFYTRR